ncbi:MAG: sensor histidine kinase [Elusimicrobiota bacterium]
MKNAELSPLFGSLADGVGLTSRELISYLNPAAAKILGVSAKLAQGRSLCRLLCGRMSAPGGGDCSARCALRDPACADKAVTFDGRFERNSFSRDLRVRCLKTVSSRTAPRPDARLTIIEDVSERENLEKEREDWRNMIAHDLRSPLSSIYSALRLMQEKAAEGVPGMADAEIVGVGVSNCRRMIDLIDLYLDVAKMEAGCVRVEFEELDFSRIVHRCLEEQSPLARERRIVLDVYIPPGLKVLADAELLPRVVQNLINNAIKFTPEGGLVELSAGVRGRASVRLCVTDTGPGIAREAVPLLFDRYHQSRARREGKIKGTGLGLAFCRKALAAMQGEIHVESELGEGSRFIIRLQAAPRKISGL